MFLKLFARFGSEVIQEVLLGDHLFYRFAMIHDFLTVTLPPWTATDCESLMHPP
jgi:hypothetical protein